MSLSPWKLQPPALPRPHVDRPRLRERLTGLKVACLVAPAGYGKTVVLTEESAAAGGQSAWYTLDPSDREPERLARGLAAALHSPAEGWPALTAWWAALTEPVTLALDNAHAIAGAEAACEQLGPFLAATPSGSRVLIAGRRDLRLPALARLRAAGQVESLLAEELAFTAEEAGEALARLSPGLVHRTQELHGSTQGWPAALLLLARERPGENALHGYLLSEVNSQLPPEERGLALALSVLPVWDQAAASHLTGRDLSALARPDLPVQVRRDSSIHPHPLWAEQLRAELQQDRAHYREAQRRAAIFFAGRGEREQALDHALAAEDPALTESLLWGLVQGAIWTGKTQEIAKWLAATPEPLLEAMPDLLLTVAEAISGSGSPQRTAPWLQRAVVGFAAAGRSDGLIRALSRLATAFGSMGEWAEARAALRQLEEELPTVQGAERGEILLALARADVAVGQADRAARRFREAADLLRSSGDQTLAGWALWGLGALACAANEEWADVLGSLREAQRLLSGAATEEARLAEVEALLLLRQWAEAEAVLAAIRPESAVHRARYHWLRAALAAQHGALEEASREVSLGERAQAEADPTPGLAAAGMLARAHLGLHQGEVDQARVSARQAMQLAERAGLPLLAALARELDQAGSGTGDPIRVRLRADLLGTFQLWTGEQEIPPDAWGRARARAVLQFLLLQPGYVTGRELLLEQFWPEENPATSRATLRVILHQVRKVLAGVGVEVETTADLVRLSPADVAPTDVALFRGQLDRARRTRGPAPERCLEHCREGRALYRGDLLPEADWPCAAEERLRLRRELAELLQLWYESALAVGRTEEAITVLEDLLTLEPGVEQAERLLIELLAKSGRRSEAFQRYRRYARWLKAEMGLDPSPETQALMRRLT